MNLAIGIIDQFHRQFLAGEDNVIYDQASDHYRSTMTRELNHAYLERIRSKMGTCSSSRAIRLFVTRSTRGTFVSASYLTECTNGQLTEVFVIGVEERDAKLDRYGAQSPRLMVN